MKTKSIVRVLCVCVALVLVGCVSEPKEIMHPDMVLAGENGKVYSCRFDTLGQQLVMCDSVLLSGVPTCMRSDAYRLRTYVGVDSLGVGRMVTLRFDSLCYDFMSSSSELLGVGKPMQLSENGFSAYVLHSDSIHWSIFPIEDDGDLAPSIVTFPSDLSKGKEESISSPSITLLRSSPDRQWVFQLFSSKRCIMGLGQGGNMTCYKFSELQQPLDFVFSPDGRRAFVLLSDGSIVTLSYDGYGRLAYHDKVENEQQEKGRLFVLRNKQILYKVLADGSVEQYEWSSDGRMVKRGVVALSGALSDCGVSSEGLLWCVYRDKLKVEIVNLSLQLVGSFSLPTSIRCIESYPTIY